MLGLVGTKQYFCFLACMHVAYAAHSTKDQIHRFTRQLVFLPFCPSAPAERSTAPHREAKEEEEERRKKGSREEEQGLAGRNCPFETET